MTGKFNMRLETQLKKLTRTGRRDVIYSTLLAVFHHPGQTFETRKRIVGHEHVSNARCSVEIGPIDW